MTYPPTAEEYAIELNASDPDAHSLVTDQLYWEECGVRTGEDLALYLAKADYSDMYKYINGVRPNMSFLSDKSVDEINSMTDEIYTDRDEASGYDHRQNDFVTDIEYDLSRHQITDTDPDPLGDIEHEKYYDPTDDMPSRSSMGRRVESTLRTYVRNVLTEVADVQRLRDEYVVLDKKYRQLRDQYASQPHDDAMATELDTLRTAKIELAKEIRMSTQLDVPSSAEQNMRAIYGAEGGLSGHPRRGLGT